MYMKEVLLVREGELPTWQRGTAYPCQLEKEEARESYGDEKVFYAPHEEAIKGEWQSIEIDPNANSNILVIPAGWVYQFSTYMDGATPLVIRGGNHFKVTRKERGWRVTRQ